MFENGDKITWKGVEHTILKTYEQTMLQIVDGKDHVRSVPLMQAISETMGALKEGK